MFEYFILGALQGIVEWLPFSSEAVLVLAQVHWLGETNIEALIKTALFFHLGTFFAALVYFRKQVLHLVKAFFVWPKNDKATREELMFYVVATIISAGIGFVLLEFLKDVVFDFEVAGRVITLVIGLLLLITAALQLFRTLAAQRARQQLVVTDAILTGVGQGFAALPGVSRSGTTMSVLLLRGVSKKSALQLSFIMSLPIVLGGNILLNLDASVVTPEALVGLVSSFIFGLATIHGLMRIAERVRFGWFVFIFGLLTLFAGLFVM